MRRAREDAGLSLEDLARRTKIPHARLADIESADVPRLPAAVYTRGFVKAYAVEVGLSLMRRPMSISPQSTRRQLSCRFHRTQPSTLSSSASREYRRGPAYRVDKCGRFARVTTVGAAIGLVIYVVLFNRQAGRQSGLDRDDHTLPTPTSAAAGATPALRQSSSPLLLP